MEITQAIGLYQAQFKLTKKQLDFLDEMCYVNIGTWDGDINELITRESKRDLALTLRNFSELRTEELEQILEENGDTEWLKRTMTKLQK